ncbi:uncharacterized protein BYT42DRAFT_582715 [Radiomyces spectabilis]|uniref:uncharacterized protein n=1 Tax=Radiomyces spectabilis TaxID=64574 RepID=UPI00221F50CA|nr:uncharacterized protein BYT42DRAFT_582715 [Radiomyces spectabilis]KAI8370522.1 hypothetical protein BYT42DRAFT_582715 [Radiomyces spectabilis]
MKSVLLTAVLFLSSVLAQEVVGRGRSCVVWRQNGAVTKTQTCEAGLTCQGFGPNEILNNGGGAHHTDFDVYRGICINMDDIQAS